MQGVNPAVTRHSRPGNPVVVDMNVVVASALSVSASKLSHTVKLVWRKDDSGE